MTSNQSKVELNDEQKIELLSNSDDKSDYELNANEPSSEALVHDNQFEVNFFNDAIENR